MDMHKLPRPRQNRPNCRKGRCLDVTRERDIDLIKALSIFGVIIIHTCSGGFTYPIVSFQWLATVFWASAVRASVPLFLMCSGVLFLPASRELSLKKLYFKTILRILAAMYVWSMLYKGYHLAAAGSLSFAQLLQAAKEVLLFKQEFHFYYLHLILLFYACLPITRVFVQHASKKELRYGLLLWFLTGILYPTLKPFWPFRLLGGIPAQWLLNMAYASIGYGVLGYYLKTHGISRRASIAAALTGFSLVFGGTFLMSVYLGSFYKGFLEGMSVGVALLAVGVFGLCMHGSRRLTRSCAAGCAYLGKASFCIYLVHVFFLYLFAHFKLTVFALPTIFSIPLLSAANLILCCGVYWGLSKIPLVSKWLI